MNIQFGRRYQPDARSRKFRIQRKATRRTSRYWQDTAAFLDQGATSQCVGYTAAHYLLNSPFVQYVDPSGIYEYAKFLDEWSGESYEGTSVLAGMKALHHLGFIAEYRWTTSLDDAVNCVLEQGPVAIGVDWYAGMMDVDRSGFIRRSGESMGGHATLINGVDTKSQKFRIKQSWGTAWGVNGRCWLSFADAAKLFKAHGEVCLAVERVAAA